MARLRTFGTALVTALLVMVGVAPPAAAHGPSTITIHSDGRGSVWITAVWGDGHPINEPVRTVLNASGDGRTVGPFTLRQVNDQLGTQVFDGTLLPGRWRVVTEMGGPVWGSCTGEIVVAASGATPMRVEVPCAVEPGATGRAEPSGAAGTPDARSGPVDAPGRGGLSNTAALSLIGGIVILGGLAYALLRGRGAETAGRAGKGRSRR